MVTKLETSVIQMMTMILLVSQNTSSPFKSLLPLSCKVLLYYVDPTQCMAHGYRSVLITLKHSFIVVCMLTCTYTHFEV